ncbi:MAG: pyridoxamine 5'-phosphate oxidase family protein [Deltaproteobacteria bacterium]|nr:pyridoxamine 5'-phosphate oxidase family protein [Deltaproteobacteria bacterium]
MSLLEQTPGLLNALRGEMTPKFLATRSIEGIPNVVPCISLLPADDQEDTLFFGNFLLRKSIKNLEADRRLSILVITPELQGWILKGDFIEFQRSGLYVDRQKNSSHLRYNAYTGVRNAGLIRIRSMEKTFAISKLQVLKDFLMARLMASLKGNGEGTSPSDLVVIPRAVRIEFARMAAVKVLSWIGTDGYPQVIPALSLQPTGQKKLLYRKMAGLPSPTTEALVAGNILTFEAISYQIKGRWSEFHRSGLIRVEEIYAGGPPYPGGRIA